MLLLSKFSVVTSKFSFSSFSGVFTCCCCCCLHLFVFFSTTTSAQPTATTTQNVNNNQRIAGNDVNRNFFIDQLFYNQTEIDSQKMLDLMGQLGLKTHTTNNADTCYSLKELSVINNIKNENNNNIKRSDFDKMCAALVYMSSKPECKSDSSPNSLKSSSSSNNTNSTLEEEHHHHHDHKPVHYPDWKKYFFGIMVLVVTWLCSMLMCILIDRMNARFPDSQRYFLITLRALAIGVLLSDSCLHILPKVLGLEKGESEEERHQENDEIMGKMNVIIATIFLMWVFETSLSLVGSGSGEHSHQRQSHPSESELAESMPSVAVSGISKQPASKSTEINNRCCFSMKESNRQDFFIYVKSVQPAGWVSFLGDVLHKAIDGLAVGAAFSDSLSLGLSTALALFFHEIPHEIGEYGILLKSGFTHCSILMLNSCTSLFSVFGFLVYCAADIQDEQFKTYVLCIIGGLFIYLALVVMLPTVKHELHENKKNYKMIALAFLFFLAGWGISMLISIFEDRIRILINGENGASIC